MATPTEIKNERTRPRDDRAHPAVTGDFDVIRCRDCGRSYPAMDGPAMLYSLKASCPQCGGGFALVL
jgi:hypothetical protein